MHTDTAFLFPGQGAQAIGMLGALADAYPQVKASFDEASASVGQDLWQLAQNGPAEALNRTENTQPALLAASVAVWRVWQEEGGAQPALLAGHSLGEYSALVCAGVLSLADGARLVHERGRLMQAAVPPGVGAMAAVLGSDDETVQKACEAAAEEQVVAPANYNSPGQIVIAGHVEAVDRALAQLQAAGVKKVVKLAVSVPSHTALMRPAADELAAVMETMTWHQPRIPVVQNVEARVADDLPALQEALKRQLYMPVRWSDCFSHLVQAGVTTAYECGPGKVLTGLARRIDRSLKTQILGTPEAMQAALSND